MNRRSFLKRSAIAAGASLSGRALRRLDPRPEKGASGSRESIAENQVPARLAEFSAPGILFRDDFSGFTAGRLTFPVGQLNGAIEEYHYIANRGVALAPWVNAICHVDAWVAGDEDGNPYLEQNLVNDRAAWTNPIFLVGDPEWSDYTVEVKVKLLSLTEMAGIIFRYHTNRHYYLFALTEGKRARIVVRLSLEKEYRVAEWRELAACEFSYDEKSYYALRGKSGCEDPGVCEWEVASGGGSYGEHSGALSRF
jgi:hypothetical protein